MNKMAFISLAVCTTLLLTGCSENKYFVSRPRSTSASQLLVTSNSIIVENEFELLLKTLNPTELVKDNAKCMSDNIHLIKKWAENYEKGIAGLVPIYYDGGGFPSSIFTLESDGTQSYVITQYKQDTGEKTTFTSSLVVERTLDYVFGADTDLQVPLIIHKQPINEVGMKWNSFINLGISPEAAEKIAKQTFIDTLKYEALGKKFHGGGIYIMESEIEKLDEPEFPKQYYRTTGAVQIANSPFYIVSMYTNEKEMNDAVQSGNVFAVSADGEICFVANLADVGWILVKDASERTIMPAYRSSSQ